MKKLFLLFFSVFFAYSFAQKKYAYEVELNHYRNAPVFENINGVLRYAGTDKKEADFFKKYTITNFYQTYPSSKVLQSLNIFTIETINANFITDLYKEFPGKYLSLVDMTGYKVELTYYPNDYGVGPYNPMSGTNLGAPMDLRAYRYIDAPKAWDYFAPGLIGTTTIGMSDGKMLSTDAEFSSKLTYVNPSGFATGFTCGSDSWHGTGTGAIAAAQGNNAYGITGICADCKILNTPYGNYNYLLDMANAGAKVINMSWISMYQDDTTYATGFNINQQNIINQLYDMGVVLVAGAGNANSYTAPAPNYLRYGYPASYDHVIAVSLVHAKNASFSDEVTTEAGGVHVSWQNEDVITITGTYESGVFTPYYEGLTTNSRVDICGPGWAPSYGSYLLGCGNLNVNATSSSTPFVTGTAALMKSLNSCLLTDELEDVLQLCAKNLESNPYNYMFVGRIGAGKLETGDSVEFVSEMKSPTGNAKIDGQDFWRFDFNLKHIFNGLTISNQTFRDQNTSNFTAKNFIDVKPNTDLKPGSTGFVDLNIDSALTVCVPPPRLMDDNTSEENIEKPKVIKGSILLFPNPNNGSFTLLLDQYDTNNLEIGIYDVMGKEVYQTKSSENSIDISLPNLPSGIYFVKLNSPVINETIKFVKQ